RYQAAFVILDSLGLLFREAHPLRRKAVSTGPAAISGVPTLRGQEHRLFYRYRGDRVVHDQVRDHDSIRSFHLQASIDLIGSYVTSDFTSVPAAVAVVPYHRPPQCGSTTIAGGSV